MITATTTTPASTTASPAAQVLRRRERPGAVAGAGLPLRYAVFVSPPSR
ncbi:MAG TPA: hypothetical protein VMH35_00820 [Streptosporangiaceae bacterium]|nr:hypothetical protein [Streptosporangiaceae bacterium]